MKKTVFIYVVTMFIVAMMCSCSNNTPGAVVEIAMNDLVNGKYEDFLNACDFNEETLSAEEVIQQKEMKLSMLKKSIDNVREGDDEDAKNSLPQKCKIIDEIIDGNTATVKYEITTVGGDTNTSEVHLRKTQSGEWKITDSENMYSSDDLEVQSDKKIADPIKVKPKSTKITGTLGEFFEVVDRTYKIRFEDSKCEISIEITRIKEGGPAVYNAYSISSEQTAHEPKMFLKLFDLDGDEVAHEEAGIFKLSDIFALSVGESTTLTFGTYLSSYPYIKDASTFNFSSTWDGINPKSGDSNTKSVSATKSNKDSSTNASGVEVILPSSLRGKVEVTHVSKAYPGEYGSAAIDVNFKLLQTVNVTPDMHGSPGGQVWIVGEVQDAGGLTIKDLMPFYNEWRTKDSYGREFKAFLQSEPGETINMTFTGSDAEKSSESVSTLCEKIAKLKLKFSK